MVRLREITGNERLLAQFVERYPVHSGVPLSIDYARRCRAWGFLDRDELLVGGFFLNAAGPFRALEDMPEKERARVMATLQPGGTFEPTCFWMARSLRGGLRTMWFWAAMLLVLWRFPARDLLACTVSRSLLDLYATVPTVRVLYRGPVMLQGRALTKHVFVVKGKRGLVRGFVVETLRRAARTLGARLLPGPVRQPSPR